MLQESVPSNPFSAFANARQDGWETAARQKEAGRPLAGYFCSFTPVELLEAAGVSPITLYSVTEDHINDAEIDLPRNLCPLIKASYGDILSQSNPYVRLADLVIGETTCDGKKKMYEILGEKKETYILQVPQGVTRPYAIVMWEKELRLFGAFLEKRFGIAITEEALRRAVADRNRLRRVLLRIQEMQKQTPPPMKGQDLYRVLDSAGFCFDLEEKIQALEQLEAVLKQAGPSPVKKGDSRILITGCPLGGVLEKTVGAVEKNGGVVVCFENCTGLKPLADLPSEDAPDLYHELARYYLTIGCSMMDPNPRRMELLRRLVEEYHIDGIVDVTLQTCHPYTVESFAVHELAKELGVPYLCVETDYSQSDAGQLNTRLAAFLEML